MRRRRLVVRAVVSAVEEPSPDELSASLTRYDDASGVAWFRGALVFPQTGDWAVASEEDLLTRRILVNGEEPETGVYLTLLDGRHANDNYRSAFVEFQASCGSTETVTCTVTRAERVGMDRIAPQDSVELAPLAWQRAPTLFAITDATYLCNADVAPMPLVPLDDPRMPAGTREFVTTGYDNWLATTTAGTAQYDENYHLACRYVASGNVADLAAAIMRNASNNTPTVVQAAPWNYYVAGEEVTWAGVNLNPAGYAALNPTGKGIPSEPYDTSLTQFMVYQLTGWEYSKLHIERNAAAWLSDYQETLEFDPNGNTWGYPRQNYRRVLQQGVLGAILRMNRYVNTGDGIAFKHPDTVSPASMATRVQNRISRLKEVAEGYASPAEIPAWWDDQRLWGVGKDEVNGTDVVPAPNFQFSMAGCFVMAHRGGIDTRDEIPTHVVKIASWTRGQAVNVGNATNGYPIYATPYEVQDPAALTPGENGVYTSDNAWLFALDWARTGSTAARDLFDHVFDERHLKFSLTQDETKTHKIRGEIFHMSMHAAAMRCGVDPFAEAV